MKEQVRRASRINFVQQSWSEGKKVNIYGLVYSLETGLLKQVGTTIKGIKDIPDHEQSFV